MQLTDLAQTAINWIMLGGVYASIAVGLALIFSVMRIIQFAHGQIFMLGAFVAFLLVQFSINYFAAVFLAVIIMSVFALVLERGFFRPLRGREDPTLIMAFGLSLLLEGCALLIFGPAWRQLHMPVTGAVAMFGVFLIKQRLVVLAVSLVAVGLLFAFVRWSKEGQAMRAVAQDPEAASLQGINVDRVYSEGFMVGSGLAVLAAGLVTPLSNISTSIGTPMLIKAFIVIILGGLGNVPGAVVGAFLLAFLDSFGTFFFGNAVVLMSFVLVVLIIMMRPAGLLQRE
jgi:branched-chain amino acid transport system permease protein